MLVGVCGAWFLGCFNSVVGVGSFVVWRGSYCFGGYVLSVQVSTCLWLISCYCIVVLELFWFGMPSAS